MMEQVNLDFDEDPIVKPSFTDSSLIWTDGMWLRFLLVTIFVLLGCISLIYMAEWYALVRIGAATGGEDYRKALALMEDQNTLKRFSSLAADLEKAEADLPNVLKNIWDGTLRDLTPMAVEKAMENVSGVVTERSVRRLKYIWSASPGRNRKLRLRGMAISLALKRHLGPEQTIFEDPGFSEADVAYLRGRGVVASSVNEHSMPTEESPPSEGEVDVFYAAHCNAALFNNLLWSHWSSSWLPKVIFVNDIQYYGISELEYLNAARDNFEHINLFDYYEPECDRVHSHGIHKVYAYFAKPEFIPKMSTKPSYYWTLTPSHLKSLSTGGLVEMEDHSQIEENIRKIREKFEEERFPSDVTSSLEKILQGRKVKRVVLVGVGWFACKYDFATRNFTGLQQLILALAMGKHFGVPVRCHELLMTEFERDYFNAIGVETPPHSDMSTPEEGLQDGEVAIFYMPRCARDLVNIVMWANRKQMRKIVFIENDFSFAEKDELFKEYKEKHWKAIGAYEKKAETIPMRNLNLDYPQLEGPFGYKGKLIVRTTNSPFQWTIITSYSGEELEGVSEEKPYVSFP